MRVDTPAPARSPGNSGVSLQTLPRLGYGYPGSSTGFTLDVIDKQQDRSNPNQWTATLTYTPPTSTPWSTSGAPFVDLPRTWSIGGELLQFADTGDWYYVNDPGDNDEIFGEVPAFRKISLGQLTITEISSSIGASITAAEAATNKKNNASFENTDTGDLLYLGFDSEEFTNQDGDKRWRIRHNFLKRKIPNKTGNGWEYVLRDDTAAWSFINVSPAANTPEPIYESANFQNIFLAP